MEAQEILQDIVFVILYGMVMGLSIAAALYLLLRRSNAIAPGGDASIASAPMGVGPYGLVLWRVETLQSLSESVTADVEEPAEEARKTSAPTATPTKTDILLKKHCEDNSKTAF